jgi:threonyl-tRNA synthetase
MEKVPYTLIIGENEIKKNTVSVRKRAVGDEGVLSVDEFVDRIMQEIKDKIIN